MDQSVCHARRAAILSGGGTFACRDQEAQAREILQSVEQMNRRFTWPGQKTEQTGLRAPCSTSPVAVRRPVARSTRNSTRLLVPGCLPAQHARRVRAIWRGLALGWDVLHQCQRALDRMRWHTPRRCRARGWCHRETYSAVHLHSLLKSDPSNPAQRGKGLKLPQDPSAAP